jgi:4'-phosphopantetheinyl transferase EntD
MTIEDIEKAVAKLPPDQFAKFRAWFKRLDAERFDQKIERDAATGTFDRLADQAVDDFPQRPRPHRLAPKRKPNDKARRLAAHSAARRKARSSSASSSRPIAVTCSSPNWPKSVDGLSYSNVAPPASFSYSTTRSGA